MPDARQPPEHPDDPDLPGPDRELASALGSLSPLPMWDGRLSFDQLAFDTLDAQRRRAARGAWTWRAVAAVLLVGLTASLVYRPAPRVVEKLVQMPSPAPDTQFVSTNPATDTQPAAESYVNLRRAWLDGDNVATPAAAGSSRGGDVPRAFDVDRVQ
jgi:hypothetical protein